MSQPRPLLILGDAPDAIGGLARITRDVAAIASRMPEFRVATLGRQARGSRLLPWPQYAIQGTFAGMEWGQADLARVWQDFAGKERGIVLSIWDPTRTFWLARPEYCGDPELEQWLRQGHFDLWTYATVDATGPGDRLSAIPRESLMGHRRILAYTKWSRDLIERSIGQPEAKARHLDWLPHGLMLEKWPLRDREEAKARLFPFLHTGQQLISAIGTNQPRKDWGLVAATCYELGRRRPEARFWWHTDLLERHWSIPALVSDYGLGGRVDVTTSLSQEELSWRLNACDVSLHPGLGEGFGYPIFESLASGCPPVHGDYAGGADVLSQCWPGDSDGGHNFLVPPIAYRTEGLHNQVRPVFEPGHWADVAELLLRLELGRERLRAGVAHLSWGNLGPLWQRWLREGL